MKTYTPRPGSFGARLLEHLTATGGTMTMLEMSQGFGEPRNNIDGLITGVIKNGLIVDCGERENGKRAYGLPGAAPNTVAPAPGAALTLGASSSGASLRIDKPKNTRQVAEKKDSFHALPKKAEAVPAAPDAPTAIASLWDDGEVVLAGITVNLDQDSVTLTDLQARQVHRFLERIYGPNV
jgi:hypothetical protein